MPASNPIWIAAGAIAVLALWLYRQNVIMKAVPKEIAEYSPHRWTKKEVQDVYDRLVKKPLDWKKLLPPKLGRRYIVVGGSGLVGGDIVLQLLQQGHSPAAIRIVDFAPPKRAVLLKGDASKVEVVKADITSPQSLDAAFSKPWPSSVSSLPLTVYHTAAVIIPWERHILQYQNVRPVNVTGAANVMAASKAAGADIFIATSSGSVAVKPVHFWGWPWRSAPARYVQFFDESDLDKPLRPHGEFFANYALAKAEAERIVCGANTEGFRTGTIRPVNGVYGDPADLVVGPLLNAPGAIQSWSPHIVQNFVHSRNVALGHLMLEAALARPKMPGCAGRTFNITDGDVAPCFADLYSLVVQLADRELTVQYPPPVLLLLVAHAIEGWCLMLLYLPFLKKLGLSVPAYPVVYLQPAVFSVVSHTIGTDAAARKSVEDGGLGFRPGCTSLEGFCDMTRDWNLAKKAEGATATNGGKVGGKVTQKLVDIGLTPEPVAA